MAGGVLYGVGEVLPGLGADVVRQPGAMEGVVRHCGVGNGVGDGVGDGVLDGLGDRRRGKYTSGITSPMLAIACPELI
ncbi:hypothetical protein SSPO_090170 [Streptomyces antimycoticus]|uniref:Uncharacterized protein n=1 Tax=Streptomyces antimycoticus TaxID=68175 RepID=A0A499VBD1_9ACTN|nr:hypothetical protein SSPO_090170 [Streptomyces antimycoticus]